MNEKTLKDKVLGCLLGGVIGDAMGAPVEGWHYERIVAEKGYITDFEGEGTDDSAIKLILCEALLENGGHATADDFAASFLRNEDQYRHFFIPVRNMYKKLQEDLDLPINAGLGNMASSSSAMSISPIGIVNACDPRTAAAEAYEVAGLIHSGCASFCRDGASAMAAAVAAAFDPQATVEYILDSATAYLHVKSAEIMRGKIKDALEMARKSGGYEAFRKYYYENAELYKNPCDSRETVPVALALFCLAGGDVNKAIPFGANFGRDADTIATMAGAVAGAFTGMAGLKKEWVSKMLSSATNQEKLAEDMTVLIHRRCEEKRGVLAKIEAMRSIML